MKPTYTFEEARVVSSPETYEIEIEINNSKVGIATQFNTPELLVSELKETKHSNIHLHSFDSHLFS